MALLFRPFTQADRSTTRRFGGSGLGLTICKRLIELMGGRIGAESTLDQGSLFWFELPFEVGDAVIVAGRAALDPASVPPLRILLAEDVPLNQELITEILGRDGHEVVVACDGEEAVRLAARGGFDLALMDVQMPRLDGVEATRLIRQLPPPAGTMPIVALTANVMASERTRYLAAGMDHCVTKPVIWPELLAVLANVVAQRGEPVIAGTRAAGGEPPNVRVAGSAVPKPKPVDEASLLDRGAIDRLGTTLPAEVVASFLRRGIENAERACERMRTLPSGSEELLREAHSLKGTSGSFGLKGISAIAERIEARAKEERGAQEALDSLPAVVAATRDALARSGLVPG
jgi:CheY-like chemotaxis protein